MTTRTSDIRRYVRELHAAREQLSRARRDLAAGTRPDAPHVLIDRTWSWAQRLLEARCDRLMKWPGVVGVGLGARVKDGMPTAEPCITVFVRRKISDRQLTRRGWRRLPVRLSTRGRSLRVDVVQLGDIERQAFAGQSLSISTAGRARRGTIGAGAIDARTGAAVFVTAMHVTGLVAFPEGTQPPLEVRAPSVSEQPGAPVIGRVIEGSQEGIDAVKVLLEAGHRILPDVPGIGRIIGWRPMTFPGDRGTSVRMFGAATRTVQTGRIENPAVFLPGSGLDSAILVSGLSTIEGDSGAALLDNDRLVLGFLVGRAAASSTTVFCPAGLALRRLKCDIPGIG